MGRGRPGEGASPPAGVQADRSASGLMGGIGGGSRQHSCSGWDSVRRKEENPKLLSLFLTEI